VLEIEVRKRLDRFELDAALRIGRREVLVLVGESGAGKTTLLRLVAGLILPDAGRIALDGVAWSDGAGGAPVPARRRPIGFVAQDYALFPHLSARDNVGFGLRALGIGDRARRDRVAAALERLGIDAVADLPPARLSGGQQQRVALARALVLEPEVLLLDEPLAALDPGTRRDVRRQLHAQLAELPCATLYVTHSPQEALAFGGRIAVLERGRITQQGSRDELRMRPRTPYVAGFLGVNLLRASVGPASGDGLVHLLSEGGEIVAAGEEPEGEVFACIDPREITLSRQAPAGSARNVLRGPVEDLQPEPPAGERLRVSLGTRPPLVAEITREAGERLGLTLGVEVSAAFKATGVRVYR